MDVTATYVPGRWRKASGWAVVHGECTFESPTLDGAREGVTEHMKAEHGEDVEAKDVTWRYVINGKDFTTQIAKAHAARVAAERADVKHKKLRVDLAEAIRNSDPEDPVPWQAIGQIMGYEPSTVVIFVRKPLTKP